MRTFAWSSMILALVALGCDQRSEPSSPNFAMGGQGRPVVLVNPSADGNGTAKTIQEGIGMVAAGGRVMVKPGTYAEAIVVDKSVTLEGIAADLGSLA